LKWYRRGRLLVVQAQEKENRVTDYEAQAKRELLAEDIAAFQKRVEVRAAKLREADRQLAEGAANLSCDSVGRKARYDELVVRQAMLLARKAWDRSAADDAEIGQLWGRIFELDKMCRQDGTLTEETA
jgi:hypothetical protein